MSTAGTWEAWGVCVASGEKWARRNGRERMGAREWARENGHERMGPKAWGHSARDSPHESKQEVDERAALAEAEEAVKGAVRVYVRAERDDRLSQTLIHHDSFAHVILAHGRRRDRLPPPVVRTVPKEILEPRVEALAACLMRSVHEVEVDEVRELRAEVGVAAQLRLQDAAARRVAVEAEHAQARARLRGEREERVERERVERQGGRERERTHGRSSALPKLRVQRERSRRGSMGRRRRD